MPRRIQRNNRNAGGRRLEDLRRNDSDGWGTAADVQKADNKKLAEGHKAAKFYARMMERIEKKPHTITPWLVIRSTADDMGVRPLTSWSPPWWYSPDIMVDTPDPLGRPVAGQANFVHARIFNLGAFDAAPVKIDFWWANPSLALDEAHMNFIGTETREIKSMSTVDVRCSKAWVPVIVNEGRECLIVNCNNWIDPITVPCKAHLDRHVGQRNVQVISATPGEVFEFKVDMNNLFDRRVHTTLLAHVNHLTLARPMRDRPLTRDLLNQLVALGAAPPPGRQPRERTPDRAVNFVPIQLRPGATRVTADFAGEPRFYSMRRRHGLTGIPLAISTQAGSNDAAVGLVIPVREVELKAGEQRTISLQLGVPGQSRPGQFVTYHLLQVTRERVIGGYTVVIIVSNT